MLKKIILKDVPEKVEEEVIQIVATVVERYYRNDVKATIQVIEDFETKVDDFRVKNGLTKKFDKI